MLDPKAKEALRLRVARAVVDEGMAEAVVAVLDEPKRFRSGRQVGSYVGLTPRRYQSGQSDRQGRISRMGNSLLRSLLVEVSWIGLRYNPWMREVYESVRRGSASRKKIAIVAVARRLLVLCWAMLRDGTTWRESHELAVRPATEVVKPPLADRVAAHKGPTKPACSHPWR